MADLDDFFAKKDRKKPKGKKFTTTEEIAKKLEEKKPEKLKKEKNLYQTVVSGQEGKDTKENALQEEEEWKEFEEEKKDYTGLKIQNLTVQDESETESEKGDEEGEMEENEQGEMVRRRKGPWKAIETENGNGATTVNAQPAPQPAETVVTTPAPAPSTGKYVSPHLRNLAGGPTPLRASRLNSKAAPDIMNTEYFPTLSAASNETPASWVRKRTEGAFEEVRNSKSHSNRGDGREVRSLEIGNKFGALDGEHS